MTYNKAIEYILSSVGDGRKKDFEKVREALECFGNPQDSLAVIHVAGTNGKGSFCAMMGSVLRAAGFKAGVFTSPHLVRFNERFKINDVPICDDDFGRIVGRIAEVSRRIFGTDKTGFAFFEILAIMAFVYFSEQNVDFLVLEVGIGGRLDVTNVIKSPLLSAIMAIGMDHMNVLGSTIEEIAKEKGGIIKENRPLVLYDDVPLVYNIFKDMAEAKNAKIYHSGDAELMSSLPQNPKLGLAGEHQVNNARVVLAACAALRDLGFGDAINDEAIKEGLKTVYHPGRMEVVGHGPLIILDGAHNLQGAEACAYHIKTTCKDKEVTLLFGVLAGKEYAQMMSVFAEIADRVILTRPINDKAVLPEELAKVWEAGAHRSPLHVAESCIKALEFAKEITPRDGVILCTGSLYLVGDLRKYVKGE